MGKRNNREIYEVIICVISFIVGVVYLSITMKATLAGDDLINGVSFYYDISHTSFWDAVKSYYAGVVAALTFKTSRFFPVFFPPSYIRNWVFKSVGVYRMYIILYTYLDVALISYLVGKVLKNKTIARVFFCITPLFIGLWSSASTNAMYSYQALVQATLFPMLLSGIFALRWHDTGKKRWMILAAIAAFYSCGTYDLGFVLIIPIWGLMWIYVGNIKKSFVRIIPSAAGEIVALIFNVLTKALYSGTPYDGTAMNLDLPLMWRTFVYQFVSGMPIVSMMINDVPLENAHLSDIVLAIVLAVAAVIIIKRITPILTLKNTILLALVGLSLMTAPAVLISLSVKFQSEAWVNWSRGYLPSVIQTLGFVIIITVLLSVVMRFIKGKKNVILTETIMALLVLCLAVMGTYQRSSARETNKQGDREYSWLIASVTSGLLDCGDDDDAYVSYYLLWGDSDEALNKFILRYTERDLAVTYFSHWAGDTAVDDIYEFGIVMSTLDEIPVAWVGEAADTSASLMDNLTCYVSYEYTDMVTSIQYKVEGEDGTTTVVSVPVDSLQQRSDEAGVYYEVEDTNIVPNDYDINMDISVSAE